MSELTQRQLQEISKHLEEHLSLISEAEMERDQQTYCTFRPSELHSTKEAIDELLALRSRDAGDEEVPYGYCPVCGTPGISRERRPNGNDRCRNGHVYPSTNAKPTTEDKLRQQLREAREEIERLKRENDTLKEYFPSGAFEAKPQHEEGDGGYYDLFPGGLYQ